MTLPSSCADVTSRAKRLRSMLFMPVRIFVYLPIIIRITPHDTRQVGVRIVREQGSNLSFSKTDSEGPDRVSNA